MRLIRLLIVPTHAQGARHSVCNFRGLQKALAGRLAKFFLLIYWFLDLRASLFWPPNLVNSLWSILFFTFVDLMTAWHLAELLWRMVENDFRLRDGPCYWLPMLSSQVIPQDSQLVACAYVLCFFYLRSTTNGMLCAIILLSFLSQFTPMIFLETGILRTNGILKHSLRCLEMDYPLACRMDWIRTYFRPNRISKILPDALDSM